MESEMNIYYDEEGDYLEISTGDISNCYFDNEGEGIFKIVDKETEEIKGISIHSFKARTKKLEEISVSLPFKLNISLLG
ncbi:MAG: hypothetical protein KJ718_01825 [Nanoarchaeota archaeon]|nr:hypothetical protein [Nanoarchaeota archaeon]MBU1051273.1 hypothetical protein [Nanoarchaeota archaeon]